MGRKRKDKPLVDQDPYAELKHDGGWTWFVYIHHGIMVWGPEGGPHLVWGTRKRAMRVAERLLKKYIRIELRRQAPRIKITSDDYFLGVQKNKALEELREPELAWDREFNRLSIHTPNEQRQMRYVRPPKPPRQIPNAGIGGSR